MGFATDWLYWLVILSWIVFLAVFGIRFLYRSKASGAALLLLIVLTANALFNIVENGYFGFLLATDKELSAYATGSGAMAARAMAYLKVANVLFACAILGLLVLRYLPDLQRRQASAKNQLQESERRFRILVDGVKEYAVYLLDPEGFVTSWNAGAERIKGYTAAEAVGMHVSAFYTQEDRHNDEPNKALDTARREGRFETRAMRLRKDGSTFWANVVIDAIRDDQGALIGFAKVTKDITESHAAGVLLEYHASHDMLTGLLNRSSLFADLRALLDTPQPVSLAIFDLDGFKKINDTHGHIFGDHLLRQVSERLANAAGDAQRIYRQGGDQFILLSSGPGRLDDFEQRVGTMARSLGEAFVVDNVLQYVGVSVGVVLDSPERDPAAVLGNAELALNDAKTAGGRRTTLFAPGMRLEAEARKTLESELRDGWARREFVLYFQPQIRLSDGAIVGAEALLRWRHPVRGVLSPAAFIDVLATSPAALDCGNWILSEACRALANWRAQGLARIRLGVNLFPAQFYDDGLAADIMRALDVHGLPPELLELEITENIALEHDEAVIAVLGRLREIGLQLAFDDFGTGFASLSYLTRYPLDRIKIDRSFVNTLGSSAQTKNSAVVHSIVAMAHNLGLEVVAEGVENAAQADFLRTIHCEEGQGYLYAKPLPEAEFEALLRQQSTS